MVLAQTFKLCHQVFSRLGSLAFVHAYPGGRFVDQIDGFIRQEAFGYISS